MSGGPDESAGGRLLARTTELDLGRPRDRLTALVCCDAARWLAWPGELPAASERERELLAAAAPADGVLGASLGVRRALAAGVSGAAALAQIDDLPRGYPLKSRWLHTRQALAGGDAATWQQARRDLLRRLHEEGLPPSETLPALLGELDLDRWRAEARLQDVAAEHLRGHLPPEPSTTHREPPAVLAAAAAGRALLLLGREVSGAKLLHAAVRATRDGPGSPRAQLFSRPVPEAAVWLRQATEAVARAPGAWDGLRHQTVSALLALVIRHRSPVLLAEGLDPLPLHFERPDAAAAVWCLAALAHLVCGDGWEGHHWYRQGLRQARRQPRGAAIAEAWQAAVRWVEQTHDRPSAEHLAELSPLLRSSQRLQLLAALARLQARLGDRDGGWTTLAAAWQEAAHQEPTERVAVLAAVGGTLLSWQQTAAGLRLLLQVVDTTATASPPLPLDPMAVTGDASEVTARLLTRLAGPVAVESLLAITAPLVANGCHELAAAAHSAAARAVDALEAPPRQRTALALARQVSDAIDPDLAADLAAAVVAEEERIRERLRVDEPR
ncbi:MAG: hypothetical protein IT204_01445 [Fimbriimonadaceae bacterium]|nr:hypothetical protein [Fimbriimonadaceae bacterium]